MGLFWVMERRGLTSCSMEGGGCSGTIPSIVGDGGRCGMAVLKKDWPGWKAGES